MERWKRSYLGLGSNLNDRQANIAEAITRLDSVPGIVIVNRSSLYESEPIGYKDQGWFVNAVIGINTTLSPRSLLDVCLGIEDKMGRIRRTEKGPREIDIDILIYGDLTVDEAGMKIPHPSMHIRRFVLVPLLEIAPHLCHPILQKSVKALLMDLGDTGRVDKFLSPCLP
ncbi:MAG TPA: 2-amino-4-hydroxy-6-hydroxymethyldihydropteridine diphosphokinase [Nitrospiria bacterium]|nr:2-amino-4-hydroxy-6-hydroxymethyldihydropteridine diphosphokinase [Nitrospiria bacterium]